MQETRMPTLEDSVHRITYRPRERMDYFRALELAERSAAFNALSGNVRQDILQRLSFLEVVELLDHLDVRRAHRILDGMKDTRRRKRIILRLKNEIHTKIEYFLQFHPQATIALLHRNYVLLPATTTIGDTAEIIADHLSNTGKIPEVLVSKNGALAGEVPLDRLVRERNSSKLGTYIKTIQSIAYNEERHEIIALFTSRPHKKVAILDADGSVLGVVYADDVLDLLGESPATSLYSFAGVEDSERPFDGMWSKVHHRYRWLVLNLGTAFLAAGIVALFEDTLAQIVLLAIYMPIIAGMGGNAATQTLAVMVRGIAVGEITLRNSWPAIFREIGAGLVNGLITGVLVALVAILFGHGAMLGLVLGLSIVSGLVVASFAGAFVPLVLRAFGKDPATSATIFITTATDVIGFLVLLGLATLILL